MSALDRTDSLFFERTDLDRALSDLRRSLETLPGVRSSLVEGGGFALGVVDTQQVLPALLDHLRDRNVRLADLHTHRPTLEDVFVSLTGRHLRDA